MLNNQRFGRSQILGWRQPKTKERKPQEPPKKQKKKPTTTYQLFINAVAEKKTYKIKLKLNFPLAYIQGVLISLLNSKIFI